jgi:UDP-N-acetylglucosamine 2-epimerase
MKVLGILGTRPEVIKLASVIRTLDEAEDTEVCVCVTSQHRELLQQALHTFDIRPAYDLDIMKFMQSPVEILSRALPKLDRVLREENPDVVLVQGDTTSAFAGAFAGFHKRIPVAHVEAGLRSGNVNLPFPEEANRRMIAALSAIHFAPTERAAQNLRKEGFPEDAIEVTGNTVVDALHFILSETAPAELHPAPEEGRSLVVVTLHRRETLGGRLEALCDALRTISQRHAGELDFVIPVHKNPRVQSAIRPALSDLDNVSLVEPLDYPGFIHLMERAAVVITDSGGVQEEAAALGKPVLIAREVTERPEVLEIGYGRLVGTEPMGFQAAVETFLGELRIYRDKAPSTVFGDGHAAKRIVSRLRKLTDSTDSASAYAV